MKLFKSLIAASLLGLCVNAQSMELVDFTRKHYIAAAVAAGSVLFNAYQIAHKVNDVNKKNEKVKQHAKTLEAIYKAAKAIDTLITQNVKFTSNNSTLNSLSAYVVQIQKDLPDLADKCSRMIASAMIVFSDSKNENKGAAEAYKANFADLMDELTPLVKFRIVETVKNAPMNTIATMAKMAKKYPKLSLATGVSGVLAYQYKYKKAVTVAIQQGISNGMFGAFLGIANANDVITNKWVRLGAAGAVASSLLVKYYDKLPKLPSLRRAQPAQVLPVEPIQEEDLGLR